MLCLVDDTPLKAEKQKCSTLFLANKYLWILLVIYGDFFFLIFHTCCEVMVMGAGFQVVRSFTFIEVS